MSTGSSAIMLGFQASYSQNSCDFDKRFFFFFFFFFFFSSDQPTEKKETHSTLNEEKGDGLTEVKKKTLYSCQQKVGLCNLATLSKVAAFGYMFLIFLSVDVKNRARDIYEVTLTKKHDTEKRERFNKH